MKLTRHASPTAFLQAAEPLLLASEAENALLYGIAAKLAAGADLHQDAYFLTLGEPSAVPEAAALRTPPFVLLMTALPPAGLSPLVETLLRTDPDLPGVLGPDPAVGDFAARWAASTGTVATLTMQQRAYRLTRVIPPPTAGRLRPCTPEDHALVTQWTEGFVADLNIHGSHNLIPVAEHAFGQGWFFLWEVDHPVAMASLVGETPNGARIGFVYTVPDQRGRGYGSACTAAISRHYLDRGRAFCCLNADLSNPASNRAYQKIGYTPIAELKEIRFTPR